MKAPHRGEIWWLEDPEFGRRPALVLTREAAIDVLTWLLVAPITRTVRGIPTEVSLGLVDGMPEPCAATLDNVRPVRKALLTELITELSPQRLDEVCASMRLAMDC